MSIHVIAGPIPLVCMSASVHASGVCVCVCRRLAWQPPPSVYECMNYCWSLWTKASSNCPKCKSKESHCILSHVKESHFVLQHIKQSHCVLTAR